MKFADKSFGVFSLCVVVLVALSVLLLVLPCLPQKPTIPTKQYSGVLEVWNVENFEGGSGSRQSWLTSMAAQFEKTHQGLFFHVTTFSPQQMQQQLQAGQGFDIICFSRGTASLVQHLLQPYTGSVAGIGENFLISGQVGNQVYALPLFCGAYCLFARQSQLHANTNLVQTALSNTYVRKVGKTTYTLQPLVCGFTSANSPLSALALSGGKGQCSLSQEVTQYAAYESFLANKTAVTLLGTQRDLYRLTRKEEAGKIEQLAFAPLAGYTDLVQYLALSAQTSQPQWCVEFMQFLVGQQAQQSLVSLNLFSVLHQSFYTNARYSACEQGLQGAYVPNVFADAAAIAHQRQVAVQTLAQQM